MKELKVPMGVGKWTGTEIPVEKRLYEILEADSIIMRRYRKENETVSLSAVYYHDNQVGFHAPESCFGGIGRSVLEKDRVEVFIPEWGRGVPVMRLKQKEALREHVVYYFYQTGGYITNSYTKVRMRILLDQLRLRKSGVALFEAVASTNGGRDEEGEAMVEDFLGELIPRLSASFKSENNESKERVDLSSREGTQPPCD